MNSSSEPIASIASSGRSMAKSALGALIAGSLFGVGLALGGMTQPAKVLGFLDFFGNWDPSLVFVMGGAVTVHAVLYRLVRARKSPLFDSRFHIPERKDIDGRLIGGAALFGVGWGLAGYCPGPAVTSVWMGGRPLVFVFAMLVGIGIHHAIQAVLERSNRQKSSTPSSAANSSPPQSQPQSQPQPQP